MNFNVRPHFRLRPRTLSTEAEGYDVEVKSVTGNGILSCLFDSPDDKRAVKRLRRSMSFFYEDFEVQEEYRKTLENLNVGEICMGRIRKGNKIIREKRLSGARSFHHHRVRVARVIEEEGEVKVELNFLDAFRSSIILPIEHVYHINPQFLIDAPYVIKCQLFGVHDFKGTWIVERVLKLRPPQHALTVLMNVRELPTEEDGLPIVEVKKKVDSKVFDMKEYVFKNLDVLGPLAVIMENEENFCRIGAADTRGHVWVCPVYQLSWAIDLMEKVSKRMYAGQELKNLNGIYIRIYGELLKKDKKKDFGGATGVYLAVQDPGKNHPGVGKRIKFNRARILSVNLHERKVSVRHIDTGEKAIYMPEDLYQIGEDDQILTVFPPLAVKVRLDHIFLIAQDGVDYVMKTVRGKNVIVKIPQDQRRQGDKLDKNRSPDARVLINPDTDEEQNLSKHLVTEIKCAKACRSRPKA